MTRAVLSLIRRHQVPTGIVLAGCVATIILTVQHLGQPQWRLPAEFEKQEVLLLAWEQMPKLEDEVPLLLAQRQVLAEIAEAVHEHIQVVILISTPEARQSAEQAIADRKIPLERITFLDIPFDSLWIRDYGPITVEHEDGRQQWLDFSYQLKSGSWVGPDGIHRRRPLDDQLGGRLGQQLNVPTRTIPLELYGGGVLSNGEGLVLVSENVVKWNAADYGYQRDDIDDMLREALGAEQLVFVTPLNGEPTGHLDVFMTFTSSHDVIVGSYPTRFEPVNAARLNQLAKNLASITSDGRPLRVHRIPMPPRGRQIFGGTYLNVVFANGVLLMPTYGIDPAGEDAARATFEKLLPDWRVIGVDCNPLIVGEGGVHCVSLNIFRRPKTLLPDGRSQQAGSGTPDR